MSAILVLYSTVDGHTLKICENIKEVVEGEGHVATLARIEDAGTIDVARFDKIVIGASIRYGKHRPSVFEFIDAHLSLLDSKPNAFFTVNIVARKPEKNHPETNPYLRKFLQKTPWKPRLLEVFAGRLDYPACRFYDRWAIRLIMWMTQGPTDPTTVVEFTDWQQVDAFAQEISHM